MRCVRGARSLLGLLFLASLLLLVWNGVVSERNLSAWISPRTAGLTDPDQSKTSKVVELDPVLAPAPPPSVASARNPLEETGSAASFVRNDRELVCSSEADPEVPLSRAALSPLEAQKMRIYCFGWTVRRPQEELLLPYARKLYEGCDSHHFFTDTQSAGAEQPDFIRVELPKTQQNRSDQFWLLLKNMVGLLPAWNYLLQNNVTDGFDWVINLELDHFFFAPFLRQTIADHTNLMLQDRLPGQDPWHDSVMMVFGNVFAFNAPLVQNMKREWGTIGQACASLLMGEGNAVLQCERNSSSELHFFGGPWHLASGRYQGGFWAQRAVEKSPVLLQPSEGQARHFVPSMQLGSHPAGQQEFLDALQGGDLLALSQQGRLHAWESERWLPSDWFHDLPEMGLRWLGMCAAGKSAFLLGKGAGRVELWRLQLSSLLR